MRLRRVETCRLGADGVCGWVGGWVGGGEGRCSSGPWRWSATGSHRSPVAGGGAVEAAPPRCAHLPQLGGGVQGGGCGGRRGARYGRRAWRAARRRWRAGAGRPPRRGRRVVLIFCPKAHGCRGEKAAAPGGQTCSRQQRRVPDRLGSVSWCQQGCCQDQSGQLPAGTSCSAKPPFFLYASTQRPRGVANRVVQLRWLLMRGRHGGGGVAREPAERMSPAGSATHLTSAARCAAYRLDQSGCAELGSRVSIWGQASVESLQSCATAGLRWE